MARERVQTRCDPSTVELIEKHADDLDESKSESVRQLIRAGLAERGYQMPVADGVGAVGEIEKLRNDMSEMEQRQMQLAEQRNRRIRRTWAGTMVGAALYVIGGLFTTLPAALVAAGGLAVLAGLALATANLDLIEE